MTQRPIDSIVIDTGTTDLLAHVEDGVAVITMNRPERRNALSGEMLEALARALAECETAADDRRRRADRRGRRVLRGRRREGHGRARTAAAARLDIDARIHRQRLSQRDDRGPPLRNAEARRSRRCPARRPAPGSRSRSPATCASRPRAR